MAMGRQKDGQGDLMVSWSEMPRSPGHVFYDRLQSVLIEGGFDAFAEASCRPYYAVRMGAPSVPPGRYFRMHLVATSRASTASAVDGDDAVTFEARLPDDPPSWVIDAERAIAAGLMTGLSPGFTVPPASAVPDAERLENEPGNPGVQIRIIREAVLREFSVVTAPAYADAVVDLRNDHPTPGHNRRRRIWL